MPIIDAERLREFTAVLQKYKTGKASLERRILAAENWWRLRHRVQEAKAGFGSPEGYQSESGWLHNVIVSKHADAMDAFPEPVLLPREPDDAREAQMLSAVLPCILEQNRFEKTYDAAMWQKLKTGTAAYRVVWDPDKLGGLGDIRIDRVDLLNLFWEPGVDDIQESRYLFCTHLEDEDLLQERYPQLRGRMGGSAFRATRFVYDDAVDLSGKATVIEVYYKKRGALHYVKYVGDTVLYATENEGNAEFGIRNSELPVGDGLQDVLQPRSGDRQRAVEGASPYGADRRFPVGALHEAPADVGRLSDERAVEGASPYGADPRSPVGALHEAPADAGRLSDERAVEGASPYEAQGDSVGAALPPLQGEVAASLRADGGVRRPPTPDRLTEDGRLIAAPTETGKTSEPNNSEFRIPNSELSPHSELGLYAHGRYPFVLDPLFPVEGSPCGYGFVDLCANAQTAIDLMRTAFVKNTLVGATPRYFQRIDGSVNEEEFTDLTKPLVHVSGNLGEDSLRQIGFAGLPGVYVSVLESTIRELRETSGNTETATGTMNVGVTAASAIAALQEASGKGSRDATRASYTAFAEIVELCIELIRQFYTLPRQFRITGAAGVDFLRYDNSGLRPRQQFVGGLPLGLRQPVFDVKVSAQKRSGYTRMAQNELAMQLYRLGLFAPGNEQQALNLLELMEFDGREELKRRLESGLGLRQRLEELEDYKALALALARRYRPDLAAGLEGNAGEGAFLPQRGRMSLATGEGEGEGSRQDPDDAGGQALSLITRSAGASPAGGSTGAARAQTAEAPLP